MRVVLSVGSTVVEERATIIFSGEVCRVKMQYACKVSKR